MSRVIIMRFGDDDDRCAEEVSESGSTHDHSNAEESDSQIEGGRTREVHVSNDDFADK